MRQQFIVARMRTREVEAPHTGLTAGKVVRIAVVTAMFGPVPNKPNMVKLVDDFQTQMDELYVHIDVALGIWDERKSMRNAGFETTLETKHLELIYESSMVQAVVAWQLFASRWVTDALVHDTTQLRSTLAKISRAEVRIGSVRVFPELKELSAHSSRETITALLETDSKFLTVNYESHWREYSKILAPTFAAKVKSLTKDDHLIILLGTKLRNASAHRSPSSQASLKEVLTSQELIKFDSRHKYASLSKGNGITVNGIGRYLAAEMRNPYGGQNTRLAFLLGYLKRVTDKLR